MKARLRLLSLLLACALLSGCGAALDTGDFMPPDRIAAPDIEAGEDVIWDMSREESYTAFDWDGFTIEAWDGTSAVQELNGNAPRFDAGLPAEPVEQYSDLDGLGRCGEAYAVVCREIQPVEARGEIGSVKPSGWHTVRYNDLISGNYLYNRCHLIGYQLAGENANEKNLITGTRFLNINGMLPYENLVDDHLEEYDHHVYYRVTPVFQGDELVARGVGMEGQCHECDEVSFFVFAYNAQPGICIDYMTGDSWRMDGRAQSQVEIENDEGEALDFVLNTRSGKFHEPGCSSAGKISEDNRLEMHEPLAKMLQAGYSPCGQCRPDR